MNSIIRTLASATVGLGLAAFTVFSAFVNGSASDPTVLGFAFLTIYGLLEMALLSYAPSPRSQVVVSAPRPERIAVAHGSMTPFRPAARRRTANREALVA